MNGKRFNIILNENNEVEYVIDKKQGVEMDFLEFMDFVEQMNEENEFLNSYLEELEDKMFSEKDFAAYLQAYHNGDVKNIKKE